MYGGYILVILIYFVGLVVYIMRWLFDDCLESGAMAIGKDSSNKNDTRTRDSFIFGQERND